MIRFFIFFSILITSFAYADYVGDTAGTSSSTLPTNAATETTLSTINGKLPSLGPASQSSSLPVNISDNVIVSAGSYSAINTNLLTGNVSDWYDAKSFHSVTFQTITTAGVGVGAITFEQTNDSTNASAGVPYPVVESGLNSYTPIISALSTGASSVKVYEAPVIARYVRVRISTAFVGGTIQVVANFSQLPYSANRFFVEQPTAGALNTTVGAVATNIQFPTGTNFLVNEVASAAITTTTTSSPISNPTTGASYEFNVPVTAVSGTNPTMDLVIQESDDSGTNWYDIYHFPRITATGIYRTPPLRQTGNRFRYVQTIAGTSPSFTRAINRLQSSGSAEIRRQFIDRTVTLTTLSSTTPTFYAEGARNFQLVFSVGAITTTAPAVQLQGSEDNSKWYAIGSPLTATASAVVETTVVDKNAKFVRAIVTTAGVGVTADYVMIKAF